MTKVHAEVRLALDATVNNVADGDTFTLLGTPHRLPVWGLDAPDWIHPGGAGATATLRGLSSGYRKHSDVWDVDRYGWILAQCFLVDG